MFGKKKEQEIPKTLIRQSVTAASVNPEAFIHDARVATQEVLQALYTQQISALPMKKIEESLYYKFGNLLREDYKYCRRTLQSLQIDRFDYSGYDNLQMYAVKSLSYQLTFTASGTYQDADGTIPFNETRRVEVTFTNDTRVGWVMTSYSDLGTM